MKRKNKKEVVKTTKFSDIISTYRAERKLTQKALGDIIGVSDRTISKWENGDTEPDLYHVKKICKTLNIPPSNLFVYKKTLNDRLHKIGNILSIIIKFILKHALKFIIAVAFLYLLLFYINNYNSIQIYSLKYHSDNIYFNHGYFYKTKVYDILTIENIKVNKLDYTPISYYVELYTSTNGDKKVIYKADSLENIYIEETLSEHDLLNKDTLKGISKGLHLKVTTTDEDGNTHDYDCSISLKEKYSNNKIIEKQYINNSETRIIYPVFYNNEVETKTAIPTFDESNTLEKLGYTYNKNKDSYTKIDNEGGKIEYMPPVKTLYYYYNDNNMSYQIDVNMKSSKIFYRIFDRNKKLIEEKLYTINKNKIILKENQKNDNIEKIQYLLDIYNNITKSL
ncbi:helix-turn-helix domain-containing protein [Clostridium sp. CAG:609]|nr:helix-turn-helix domain-containing protein [Clostridium sp. CAG:609]